MRRASWLVRNGVSLAAAMEAFQVVGCEPLAAFEALKAWRAIARDAGDSLAEVEETLDRQQASGNCRCG